MATAKTQTQSAYDLLEAMGVKPKHKDADKLDVGTLLADETTPFDVIGIRGAQETVAKLQALGRFSRVSTEAQAIRLESQHFERISDPRVVMRGCPGGILLWRAAEHERAYQERRQAKDRARRWSQARTKTPIKRDGVEGSSYERHTTRDYA